MHRFNRARALAVAVVLTGTFSACGDENDYENDPRPPSPIVVSGVVTDDRVSISPRTFGAGPITLIATNQTQQDQELTLETDEIGGSEAGIEQRTGPINPGATASLKANLGEGTYRVAVNGRGIDEAALDVGEERESAQNELLQP